jgi:hypothetical protein
VIRLLGAVVLASSIGAAAAHDLITTESAERYLGEGERLRALAASGEPAPRRAEANYRLGVMLDEIRELLNRDLAAHGEVQGLPSKYLLAELGRRGNPLAYSESRRMFLSNADYFRAALRIAPQGRYAADAAWRLLQGGFYDSIEQDPLTTRDDPDALRAQIALAERLLTTTLPAAEREELEFIAAILYTRAAKTLPDRAAARAYASKARAAVEAFESRYPESLRAAVMPVLREALAR